MRERTIEAKLPPTTKAADLPAAIACVLQLVGSGEITPSEGSKLADLLGSWRQAIEVAEIEARLAALEALRP